ncbi:heme ABC exporter, ATP-binding protein CcmA [Burkholderiales bacterium GJ-E10]|nr:heme ABC exporter, ATP-binding protein CcmA [Burkholderiales bacterium GJ-E10]
MLQAIDLQCIRGERRLFERLSFELRPGEGLHIAGENGAGKTTLLRVLCGLLQPTEGEVRWDGKPILRAREEFGADLAFVGHLNGVKDDLTALENIRLEAAIRGAAAQAGDAGTTVDAAEEALARMGLGAFGEVLARHLSQGQKRRVALARLCGAASARIWILDEPFNALDAAAVATLNDLISAQLARGGIVVLTAHLPVGLSEHIRRLELRAPEPDEVDAEALA